MIYNTDEFLKLIYDTKALSIWNRQKGPVFWYALGVPGPFYINTNLVIGPDLGDTLLEKISVVIAETADPAARAEKLKAMMRAAYIDDPLYRNVIETMVARGKQEFPAGSYDLVSGGERKDWLFSIPFAHELNVRHVYLFKDQSMYCEQEFKPHEKVLHVSDLINNAASYFDLWFPVLDKVRLKCVGTICVNSRNVNGVEKLEEGGLKVVALNTIDLGFFERLLKKGSITQDVFDEIAMHFSSSKEWAKKYLLSNPGVFNVKSTDKKSFERLQSFVANDPWNLRQDQGNFFSTMQTEIAKRLNA